MSRSEVLVQLDQDPAIVIAATRLAAHTAP